MLEHIKTIPSWRFNIECKNTDFLFISNRITKIGYKSNCTLKLSILEDEDFKVIDLLTKYYENKLNIGIFILTYLNRVGEKIKEFKFEILKIDSIEFSSDLSSEELLKYDIIVSI